MFSLHFTQYHYVKFHIEVRIALMKSHYWKVGNYKYPETTSVAVDFAQNARNERYRCQTATNRRISRLRSVV